VSVVVELGVGDGRPGTRGCKFVAKALNDGSLGTICLIVVGGPRCDSIRDTTEGGSRISAMQRVYTLQVKSCRRERKLIHRINCDKFREINDRGLEVTINE